MPNDQGSAEIARFYTRSRRFPKVLGRLHDGTRIPGGPYTLTQAVAGVAVGAVAMITRAQWGTGAILIDIPLTLAITWGTAWGVGRIPATRRNLVYVVAGGVAAMMRPFEGRYRDQTLKLSRPHFVAGVAFLGTGSAAPQAPRLTRSLPAAAPTMVPAPPPARAITAVERLLQQTQAK